mgnify:CR=1 FL=1
MSHISMASIMDQFGGRYTHQYPYRPEQQQVVSCIRQCRTPALGFTQLHCNGCTKDTIHYHSCRNRHCPQCQRQASEAWREQRRQDLLPVSYFHLVFTLPHALNGWVRLHPRVMYRCLFHSVWQTLKRFGQQRLQGELGATVVLHSWGQALDQHIHLHVLIPAGAWSKESHEWHPANGNYLFPVKALSRGFRGRMVSELRTAFTQGELSQVTREQEVSTLLNNVMKADWVVYTKACHGKPERVLDYLSRYTYRIAIAESRLINVTEDHVRFRWKDYRDGKQKAMQLTGVEFLRRFLQHVLPRGFMRIRHYGFLSNRYRRPKLEAINHALGDEHSQRREVKVVASEVPVVEASEQALWFCCHCHSRDTYVVQQVRGMKERPRG